MKFNVTARLEVVTPEMAADWLSRLWGAQRRLRRSHVLNLMSDMLHERFKVSPDAILIIKNRLANGQHRLTAVVETGKPQSFIILESDDEELYKVVDSGLRRSASDALLTLPYYTALPSIARWIQRYQKIVANPLIRRMDDQRVKSPGSPTQCEVIDYCVENQDMLVAAAGFVMPLYIQTKLLNVSIGGAMYCLASDKDGALEKAKRFLTEVYLGGETSSASLLRNRLIAEKSSKSRLPSWYLFALVMKALKFYLNDITPGMLSWGDREDYPILFDGKPSAEPVSVKRNGGRHACKVQQSARA